MDIFEGGPRRKFFEILSAEGPALAQSKTNQALIRSTTCERLCEARGKRAQNPMLHRAK